MAYATTYKRTRHHIQTHMPPHTNTHTNLGLTPTSNLGLSPASNFDLGTHTHATTHTHARRLGLTPTSNLGLSPAANFNLGTHTHTHTHMRATYAACCTHTYLKMKCVRPWTVLLRGSVQTRGASFHRSWPVRVAAFKYFFCTLRLCVDCFVHTRTRKRTCVRMLHSHMHAALTLI